MIKIKKPKPTQTKPKTNKGKMNAQMGVRGWTTIYKPELCKRVIELGEAGYSVRAMAAEMGINRDTLTRWSKTKPEFAAAMEQSRDLAYLYYFNMGKMAMQDDSKSFNTILYKYMTMSTFPKDFRNDHGHETNINTDGQGGLSIVVKSYADHPTE